MLDNAQTFQRLLTALDQTKSSPTTERIERMWDYFAGVIQPDGFGPLNNDSDREYNAALLKDASVLYDRTDWLAIATQGETGDLPAEPASRFYPWAGQVILRNNWSDKADWIYFDAGPYGTAHQHKDRLHISAFIKGRPLLVDTGRYTYQPGPLRDFFVGGEGHSVLLLNGEGSKQGPREVKQPLPIVFQREGDAVLTAAKARFASADPLQSPTPWTRAILYTGENYAILADHLVTFSPQPLEARWQFHPDVTEAEAKKALRLIGNDFSQTIQTGSTKPPVGGFYSPDYNMLVPAPMMRFTGTITRPTTLVWILQDPNEPPINITRLSPPGAPILHLRIEQENQPPAERKIQLHPTPQLRE